RALNTGAMIHKEENLILISKDGRELPIDENAAPILNNQGNILGAIAMIRDVTSQRETQAKIQFMANHDELTKLPNRYFLNTRLETAIADANITGNKIALMYLDLDGFKQVNDRFGHNIGDKILQQVTTRLEESIRGSDIVARLGGDEFLFLLDNLKATSDSTLVAKKVLEKFKNPFKVDDQSVTISASIGISIFPDDSDNPVELLVLADRAMYAAKNDGKNMFKHYRPTMIIDGKIKK
ncbi:MAG: GGDEF domain-containing protein, partial [Candidatus Heimdallarchaeota archaeon]|nr:GGDEF domain-containing protein [Candidatus Heimdallarchaeota archaeon]